MPPTRPTTVLFVEGCRDGSVGGSHTCLLRLISHLDRERFHPVVVFYDDHAVAQGLRDLGVEVIVLPNARPLDLVGALRRRSPALTPVLAQMLARLVRPAQQAVNLIRHFAVSVGGSYRMLRRTRADILHLNNSLNTNHEWMMAGLVGRIPVISHERGISPRLSRTSRWLGGRMAALVCVSRAVQAPLVAQQLPVERMPVVYDGIDPAEARFSRSADEIRDACGIPRSAPVIGVLGNIKHWKGQETVIRALGRLQGRWPELRCLLVGTVAEPGYQARLDGLVTDLGLTSVVTFTGYQPRPWDFLQAMDIVVHASIEPEPFGMVNLEAMCLGKPVVSTTIGGPAEIFEDGRTGCLVPPGDAAALADQLTRLLSDPDLRARLGAAGRASVVERFTVADTVRPIESLYRQLGAA